MASQNPIGSIMIRKVEIEPSQDWKQDRFVMKDRAKRNLLEGVETAIISAGYESAMEEAPGGLALDVVYRNSDSAVGAQEHGTTDFWRYESNARGSHWPRRHITPKGGGVTAIRPAPKWCKCVWNPFPKSIEIG